MTTPEVGSEVTPGLVVVDKPAGLTSHDVVARVRRLAGTRRVGHAGTLDPMATGVLVVGVGRATRLLGHLASTEKGYDATVRLGAATTTDDAEGDVIATASTAGLTEPAVRAALAALVGHLEQVPSSVSAVKVDGRRAYARVRAGEPVVLEPRAVVVHALTVHRLTRVDDHLDVDLSLRCSSGTYVRAVARDVGATLGVGGHLTALRRTAVGSFGLAGARTLDQLAADFSVVPLTEAARRAFAGAVLDAGAADDVRVGRRLRLPVAGVTAVFAPDGEFLALYRPDGDGARALAVFSGASD